MIKKSQKKSFHKNCLLSKYIPYPVLIIPGLFLLASIFLLLNNLVDWAFLSVGFSIVIAILIRNK